MWKLWEKYQICFLFFFSPAYYYYCCWPFIMEFPFVGFISHRFISKLAISNLPPSADGWPRFPFNLHFSSFTNSFFFSHTNAHELRQWSDNKSNVAKLGAALVALNLIAMLRELKGQCDTCSSSLPLWLILLINYSLRSDGAWNKISSCRI